MSIFRRAPQELSLDRLSSSTSDLDPFERELLEAITSAVVPPHAKDAIWPALCEQAAAEVATQQRLSVFRRALEGAPAKAVLAFPAIAGLGIVAFISMRHFSRPPPRNVPAPIAIRSATPSAPPVGTAVADVVVPTASASTSQPTKERIDVAGALPRGAHQPDDELGQEVALLVRARAELRAGNARAAQITLAQMQSQFPGRSFGQERQVLGILAQNAIGNRSAARQAAAAFVKAHPESPHAAQLLHVLEQD